MLIIETFMSDNEKHYPTRRQALVFGFKAAVLRWLRRVRDWRRPLARHRAIFPAPQRGRVIGEVTSPLWSDGTPAERVLQLGKVENLRRAIRGLDGVQVPAGQVMSFWRQVGKPSRSRGFAPGRELRQGCIIPTVGGGLCQLSNGLYQAAVQAGLQIVERHPHTQVVPGSAAALGQDATVFWNYIDLRLAAPFAWRLDLHMDAQTLRVRIIRLDERAQPERVRSAIPIVVRPSDQGGVPGSCDCCGQVGCYLNIEAAHPCKPPERSAYLLDVAWPEFQTWVEKQDRTNASLLQSWEGQRSARAHYAWPQDGWAERCAFNALAMARALVLRLLAQQGAARQRAHLFFERWLARRQAARLDPGITHLVVAQPLLPHLQRLGVLAGREVDVLMVRAPLDQLQKRLDAALCAHPHSATLGDFRADDELVALERKALDAATRLITPHTWIAEQFGPRAQRIDWRVGAPALPARPREPGSPMTLAFLGPTAGRRGAWEARAAFQTLSEQGAQGGARWRLVVVGSQLEGADFWAGLPVEFRPAADQTFADVDVLVSPAWVDHAPRRALQFLAAGRRVIASRHCGLPAQPGLTLIESGDLDALKVAIESLT